MRVQPRVVAVLAFLLMLPLLAMAQSITAPPAPQAFPWEAVAVNWISALQVVLIPALVEGVKRLLKHYETRVPRMAFILFAVTLGVGSDAFMAWVAAGGFSPLRGVALGFLSVALREILSTLNQHGLTGK